MERKAALLPSLLTTGILTLSLLSPAVTQGLQLSNSVFDPPADQLSANPTSANNPTHYNLNTGAAFTIICTFTYTSDAFIVSFYKDGVVLSDGDLVDTALTGPLAGTEQTLELAFSDFQPVHDGVYHCFASTSDTSEEVSSDLYLYGSEDPPPPPVRVTPRYVVLDTSADLVLEARFRGNFYSHDWEYSEDDPSFLTGATSLSASARITNVGQTYTIAAGSASLVAGYYGPSILPTELGVPIQPTPENTVIVGSFVAPSALVNGATTDQVMAAIGENVTFTCTAHGFPETTLTIQLSGVTASHTIGSQTLMTEATPTSSMEVTRTVTLHSVTVLDCGAVVTCVGSNMNRDGSTHTDQAAATLRVQAPPSVNVTPSEPLLSVGNPLTLTCTRGDCVGTTTFTFSWILDGSPVDTSLVTTIDSTTSQLSVTSVTSADFGTYTCQVTNVHGTGAAVAYVRETGSLAFTTDLTAPPAASLHSSLSVLDGETNRYNIEPDTNFSLTCTAESPEDFTLFVYRLTSTFTSYSALGATYSSINMHTTFVKTQTLKYSPFTSELNGMYWCRAESLTTSNVLESRHILLGTGPATVTRVSDLYVELIPPHPLELEVMVAGAYERLTWSRGGMELVEGAPVSFTNFRQTLSINNTSSGEAGEYTAAVSASASVTFQVQEFSAPQINISVPSHVIRGDTLTANISVVSFPQSNVSLLFGGTQVVTNFSEAYDSVTGLLSYFTTHSTPSIHLDYKGNYTCLATITHGQPEVTGVYRSFVTVYVAAPVMLTITASPSTGVPQGMPLNLTCEVVGGPILSVMWTTPTGPRMGSVISVGSVMTDDAGEYRCEVMSDRSTTDDSITIRVGVRVITPPTDQSVSINDTLLLTCNVSGSEPISYQWSKDGVQLQDGGRVSGSNSSVLRVKPVEGNDFGDYQCHASNDVDQAMSEVVQVAVAPTIVNILASPSTWVPQGATVNLTCEALGGPFLKVMWTTPTGSRMGSVISVESVTAENAGIYRCEVMSEAGTAYGSITIIGCPASSWTPPLLVGESFSLPCSDIYHGFNPRANVTWTCNGDLSLIFGIWNCTFGERVTISELGFDEHVISLEMLNETLAQLQSQAESTVTATVVNTRIGGSAFADTVTVTLVIENPPNLPTIKFRFNPGSFCYCPPTPLSKVTSRRLCIAPDYVTTPCQCPSEVCECNTNGIFIDYFSSCTTDTDGDGTPNAYDDCEGCCLYEISEGFLWPSTSHGAEVHLSCSMLHTSFVPSSMATRRCSQEGQWEAVDTLGCTFQKKGISLVVVKVVQNFGGTSSAVQLEVNQTLSDAGFVPKNLTLSATNLQYTAFHTELVIVAEFDGTTDTSIFTALLHNVERRSVHRQASGRHHSVVRRAATAGVVNATTGYVADVSCPCPLTYLQSTFNVRCSGPPGLSCACTDMTCKCADPYAAVVGGTSETLECSVDTDGDGIPDIEDPCPEVYSPDGEEQCTSPATAQCPIEVDTTWGVTWSATRSGEVDVQRCPGGLNDTVGLARRTCNSSSGEWEEPDVSECESLAFRNVRSETSNLLQSLFSDPRYMESNGYQPVPVQSADVQVIVETTSFLVNSTNAADARVPLFPKDLNSTNNFLDVIALFANSTDLFATEQYAEEESLQIASNILSPNYTSQWGTLNKDTYSGGAPLLLQSVENIAVSAAVNLASNRMANVSQDGTMEAVFKSEHLAIQVALLQPGPSDNEGRLTYNDVLYPRDQDATSAVASSLDLPSSMVPQMVIPGALLEERATTNMPVPVVNVIISNLDRILPNMYSNGSSIGSLRPSSLLISGQVARFQEPSNTLQATPVRITFPVPDQSQEVLSTLQCVYWNFISDTSDLPENLSTNVQFGGWSSQGLRLLGSWENGSTHVVCESTHLTSFAMLVDYSGVVAEEENVLFSILTYVGCGISILCLLGSIVFFLSLKRELYTNVVHFVHLNFCIALLCGLVAFLTIAPVGLTQSEAACTTVAILTHYFFLAAFSWMLCEGLMMYILLVRVFGAHKKKWLIVYTLIGWGLPVPIVSVALIVTLVSNWNYYIVTNSNVWYCWLPPDNGVVWAFIAPMFLSIIINCVFAFLAIRGVYKFRKEQLVRTSAQKRNQKLVMYCLKAILIILPLTGFTWLFGTLAAFNYSEIVRNIFSVLFVVCNTLQGVAIFVFHVVRHEKNWGKLKRLFTSKIGKSQDTRTTNKSGAMSTSQGKPLTMEYAGLQSQSEAEGNDINILRSLPSDDDNDNLPLVLQREESLKVKEEWNVVVTSGQLEESSKL